MANFIRNTQVKAMTSTVVKHIMLSEYMKGTKILCIDPESEVRHEVAQQIA